MGRQPILLNILRNMLFDIDIKLLKSFILLLVLQYVDIILFPKILHLLYY